MTVADRHSSKKGEPAYEVLRFGAEEEPVAVIDDFSSDPFSLGENAQRQPFEAGGRHYPGQRAPAPSSYLAERMDTLQAVLSNIFGVRAGAHLVECNYSIVTTPPAALTPIQRLPHFDSTDPGYIALLHYLCGPEHGGTSFYRHVSTGFETISEERLPVYDARLKAEVEQAGLPDAGYFSGSTGQFEQIGHVEARFNRMVIYRGLRLHSGDILRAGRIGQPGEAPRLTVNTFLKAES